jgi:hypothetical protein
MRQHQATFDLYLATSKKFTHPSDVFAEKACLMDLVSVRRGPLDSLQDILLFKRFHVSTNAKLFDPSSPCFK